VSPASPPPRVRVDMHSHTRRSFDCLTDPRDLLRVVRARGIDRIFVTDHNAIDAALRLREVAPETILVGEEIKTREGFDLIGLFLTELIPRGTPAREAAESIRAQGGVVYLPHPFDLRRSGAGPRHAEALSDLIDVVEVHNARCLSRRTNELALRWAEARKKLQGAGSDAHTAAELGSGFVEMPDFAPDRDSFLTALAGGVVAGQIRSSPVYRLASTYAKLHKRVVRNR